MQKNWEEEGEGMESINFCRERERERFALIQEEVEEKEEEEDLCMYLPACVYCTDKMLTQLAIRGTIWRESFFPPLFLPLEPIHLISSLSLLAFFFFAKEKFLRICQP